ncbi:hypothetical protein D3C78_1941080 [compost metagenome]
MSDVKWTVVEPSGAVTRTSKKIPYVATQRMNDKMDNSQKEGVRVWNLMVNTLRENGLMEDKQGG